MVYSEIVGNILGYFTFTMVLIAHYTHAQSTKFPHNRTKGVPPVILVHPETVTHTQPGMMFVMSCRATGSPIPGIIWYKDGFPIPTNVTRISTFDSGYLLVSEVRPEDAGEYQCVAVNKAGKDHAEAKVLVSDMKSGCADRGTDGLFQYEKIQACQGQWQGHVKRGRRLCAKGWKVCSSRDVTLLKVLTWDDVTRLMGCYAYNAENSINQCNRCHRGDIMAGVGNKCGRIHRKQRSCLSQGRIDVYRYKDGIKEGCHYKDGYVTGVLCCKNRKKPIVQPPWKWPRCSPKCDNGGTCVSYNRCECMEGYKGAWCQHAYCPGGCIPHATCVKPGVCRCNNGYVGEKCKKERETCLFPCQNGGRCKAGKCKCSLNFNGPYCHHKTKWQQSTLPKSSGR